MRYLINKDTPTRTAKIHREDCRHAREDWPSHNTIGDALYEAARYPIKFVHPCGVCLGGCVWSAWLRDREAPNNKRDPLSAGQGFLRG